ncbi:YicC/YloC family endoribonuclease [Pleomorphochaeta sp. DL1XJH-081]|uniref:YicC/YloC family endoribonuclease n=1 Tax=Pleomorphochaeta sp. DL1XJH-081 TaxID=3409690 RepID=UPI003BB53E69
MLSMTGYGYAERLTDDFLLTVEVKSYNNRYLEIVHTLPNSLSRFEQEMDRLIKEVVSRGRVELSVRLKQINIDLNLHVDEGVLPQYRQAFERITRLVGSKQEPSLGDYLAAEGVVVSVRDTEVSRYEAPLMELLDQALLQFRESKEREGAATRDDLTRLARQLEEGLGVVASYAGTLEQKLKDNLITRFDEMLGSKGYDENRFMQEVAILLSKYSVNEEIVRLQTHIEALKSLLNVAEPVGKRLDFLSQEMNREINTIGSKSILVEINQQVVQMKDSLENIREQVRNIE